MKSHIPENRSNHTLNLSTGKKKKKEKFPEANWANRHQANQSHKSIWKHCNLNLLEGFCSLTYDFAFSKADFRPISTLSKICKKRIAQCVAHRHLWEALRLSENFKPLHYDASEKQNTAQLKANRDTKSFSALGPRTWQHFYKKKKKRGKNFVCSNIFWGATETFLFNSLFFCNKQ